MAILAIIEDHVGRKSPVRAVNVTSLKCKQDAMASTLIGLDKERARRCARNGLSGSNLELENEKLQRRRRASDCDAPARGWQPHSTPALLTTADGLESPTKLEEAAGLKMVSLQPAPDFQMSRQGWLQHHRPTAGCTKEAEVHALAC